MPDNGRVIHIQLEVGNIGMIIAQGGNALVVKNCRIAGTLSRAGEEIVLSASNYSPLYAGGTEAGSKTVVDPSCGFNDGQ